MSAWCAECKAAICEGPFLHARIAELEAALGRAERELAEMTTLETNAHSLAHGLGRSNERLRLRVTELEGAIREYVRLRSTVNFLSLKGSLVKP